MDMELGDLVILDSGSSFIDALVSAVYRITKTSPKVVRFPDLEIGKPENIIFSGRAIASKLIDKWAFKLLNITEGSRSLNICYGAEALNLYKGGSLVKLPESISGIRPVNFFEKNQLGITGEVRVFESRKYGIGRLGKGLRVIANGNGIEGFVDEESRRIGLMFHPERSGKDGDAILSSFLLLSQKL
ncbi:MAG: hypothetical protein JRN19_00120 [Nitrososphaerota archaeon]|nr:hypothetical protein [Nitrososphaerota archaeon]